MAAKPMPGHKLAAVRYFVEVECECGWKSARWIGKGARGQCYRQWRWHKDACEKATA